MKSGTEGTLAAEKWLLSMHRSEHGFETLGGLESSSSSVYARYIDDQRKSSSKCSWAIALGRTGTGKSAFAKALGKETERPVLCLDVGALMGS